VLKSLQRKRYVSYIKGTIYSSKSVIKRLESPEAIAKNEAVESSNAEIKKLQKELKRVKEERDILKKAAVYFASHTN